MNLQGSQDLLGNYSYTYGNTFFGGGLKTDSTFRFNISRYVQSIVTTHAANNRLRLYVPVRANVFSTSFGKFGTMAISDSPAYGRIVLSGGAYADTPKRLRLRIVYSKL
jgi:hypothetical protein